MAIFDRFFGRHKEESAAVVPPKAPAVVPATPAPPLDDASRLSLQLLFPDHLSLDAFVLSKRLCAFHPALNIATVEIDAGSLRTQTPTGRARWGMHQVDFTGANTPIDARLVESCVGSMRFSGAGKQEARTHRAHVNLYYTGTIPSTLDQYVALAAVAGTLGSTGAVAVLNQNARTGVPIDDILPSLIRGDRLDYLRTLPIPLLYAGFAELDVAGQRGVWMRTFGCQFLKLPNLAMFVPDRSHHDRVFQIFSRVFGMLLKAQRRLEADATMMVSDLCVGFRNSSPAEFFLHDSTDLLVVEIVDR